VEFKFPTLLIIDEQRTLELLTEEGKRGATAKKAAVPTVTHVTLKGKG
jgi:hypothetical protein